MKHLIVGIAQQIAVFCSKIFGPKGSDWQLCYAREGAVERRHVIKINFPLNSDANRLAKPRDKTHQASLFCFQLLITFSRANWVSALALAAKPFQQRLIALNEVFSFRKLLGILRIDTRQSAIAIPAKAHISLAIAAVWFITPCKAFLPFSADCLKFTEHPSCPTKREEDVAK